MRLNSRCIEFFGSRKSHLSLEHTLADTLSCESCVEMENKVQYLFL